jgi:hypothetical protein
MDAPANKSKFVTCQCQHCEGHIEFDGSDFQKGETRKAECPHCHLETVISVPKQRVPPVIQFRINFSSRTTAIFFAVTTFCLASILIWEHLAKETITQISLDTKAATSAALQGEVLNVSKNGMVLSTFTMEPIYQMGTTTRFVPGVPGAPGRHEIVSEKDQVGENKVPGRKIILRNYPAELYPAVGQTISFRGMRVGTANYKGDILELWDYETP